MKRKIFFNLFHLYNLDSNDNDTLRPVLGNCFVVSFFSIHFGWWCHPLSPQKSSHDDESRRRMFLCMQQSHQKYILSFLRVFFVTHSFDDDISQNHALFHKSKSFQVQAFFVEGICLEEGVVSSSRQISKLDKFSP